MFAQSIQRPVMLARPCLPKSLRSCNVEGFSLSFLDKFLVGYWIFGFLMFGSFDRLIKVPQLQPGKFLF